MYKHRDEVPLDPEVRRILTEERRGRMRRLAFEKLGRLPTVDEIRFDFGVTGDGADLPDGHEYSLDAYDSVRVLLARIDELEGYESIGPEDISKTKQRVDRAFAEADDIAEALQAHSIHPTEVTSDILLMLGTKIGVLNERRLDELCAIVGVVFARSVVREQEKIDG